MILQCLIVFLHLSKIYAQFNPSILQDARNEPKLDGTFGFLYRTENGISHSAKADPGGIIHGTFSYTDPTGLKVNYNYNAGSGVAPKYNYNAAPAPAPAPAPAAPAPVYNNYNDQGQVAQQYTPRTKPPTLQQVQPQQFYQPQPIAQPLAQTSPISFPQPIIQPQQPIQPQYIQPLPQPIFQQPLQHPLQQLLQQPVNQQYQQNVFRPEDDGQYHPEIDAQYEFHEPHTNDNFRNNLQNNYVPQPIYQG